MKDESFEDSNQLKRRILNLRPQEAARIFQSRRLLEAVVRAECTFISNRDSSDRLELPIALSCPVSQTSSNLSRSEELSQMTDEELIETFQAMEQSISSLEQIESFQSIKGPEDQITDRIHEWIEAGAADDIIERSHEQTQALTLKQSLFAGGIAGATAKTCIAPLDRVKILFQINATKPFSIHAAFTELLNLGRAEGIRALWRGNSAMMIRVVPYAAIQFSTFEHLKRSWAKVYGRPVDEHSPVARFVMGGLAGSVSVMCTYPLDLMRAKMAAQRGKTAVRSTAEKEGIAGLFRGLNATLFGIFPYAGTSFMTFETLKTLFLHLKDESTLSNGERLVSGAVAGIVAQSATYPLDIVRRRFQVHGGVIAPDGSQIRGIWASLQTIYKTEGVSLSKGLYKGLAMNWIKGPIASAISFTVFDTMKSFFIRNPNSYGSNKTV